MLMYQLSKQLIVHVATGDPHASPQPNDIQQQDVGEQQKWIVGEGQSTKIG